MLPSQDPADLPRPSREDGPAAVLGDAKRLAAVRRVIGSLVDGTALDRLTRLAALLLDAPRAQVSLIGEQQAVASLHGGSGPGEHRLGPVDDSLCSVTLLAGAPVAVTDARNDDRVCTLPPVVSCAVSAYLGVPLIDAHGLALGALCVMADEPRRWTPAQVGILVEVAESVVAELELRALSAEAEDTATRLRLALEASGVGSFDLDLETSELVWDERLIRLFGYDEKGFVPHLHSFIERVHPDDLERVSAAISRAGEASGDLSVEYRIVRPDGSVRWVEARGRVLTGWGGRSHLLGVAYDSTELREARDSLARVFETMTDAFYRLDADWRVTYVNSEAVRVLRRTRAELLGVSIWESFPEALDGQFPAKYAEAVATGEPVRFEEYFGPLESWFELTAWPGPDGLSVYFRDITERRRVETEREQAVVERAQAHAEAAAANTRLALIADASIELAASLEPQQVLERFADLVVPGLAEWVVIALTADTAALLGGRPSPAEPPQLDVVHVGHGDAVTRRRLIGALRGLRLTDTDEYGIGAVVRTGRPEWLPVVPTEILASFATEQVSNEQLEGLGLRSALTLPLRSRGRTIGAVTVADPAGGSLDRSLLMDLAGRAAVALDNALLYRSERRTGLTLQRSLLPGRLPDVEGVQMAARYLPGATGAFVGGDWYQGVRVGSDLVLAMGEVMVHGMPSAARMGQLRAIVATLALEGHSPAALLERLSANVEVLLDLELATLLVACYDPVAATLTVASAGHPPPLLAVPGAPPRFVEVVPGPPLGTFAATYDEVKTPFEPGTTAVLYTDGLVEVRDASLDVGLERLRSALVDVRLPPEAVCDHVLRALGLADGGDDDVALLVVSLFGGPA